MIRFLLDEDTPGILLRAIRRHNLTFSQRVECARVGEPGAPPTGTPDPDNLIWCEENGHILLSGDRRTLVTHFHEHLAAGRHSPGVLLLRPNWVLQRVIETLTVIVTAGVPDDFRDQVQYIPL